MKLGHTRRRTLRISHARFVLWETAKLVKVGGDMVKNAQGALHATRSTPHNYAIRPRPNVNRIGLLQTANPKLQIRRQKYRRVRQQD